jgi:hypothetical protein
MPCPFDNCAIFFYHGSQMTQSPRIKFCTTGNRYLWMKPKFGFTAAFYHMNMQGFTRIALVRVKEESEPVMAENRWHAESLLPNSPPVTPP